MVLGMLALSLLAMPLLAACGQKEAPAPAPAPAPKPSPAPAPKPSPAPAPKPTPAPAATRTVKVGYIAGFTGPLAEGTKEAFAGAKAVFDWANETNYIPGLKVEMVSGDDQYQAAKVMQAYKQIQAEEPIAFLSYPAGNADVLKEVMRRNKTPLVNYGGGNFSIDPPGWVFVTVAMYDTQQFAVLKWINENWDVAREGRPARFAHLAWDNSMGTSSIKPGMLYAEQLPLVDYVAAEVAPSGTMDFTPYITRLKQKDPDFIYMALVTPPAISAVKTGIAMGIPKEKFMYFDYVTFMWGAMLRAVGNEVVEGAFVGTSFYHYTIDTPGMQKFWGIWDKYSGLQRPVGLAALVGYNPGLVLLEGMKRAAATTGADKITGEDIYKALQTIKDFNPGTMVPVTFGPDIRDGAREMLIYKVKDGKIYLVGDVDKPIDGGNPHPSEILAAAAAAAAKK